MKNVKLFLSTVVLFLALGISTVNAQQKQSVMVTETIYSNITIEVIKPDYSVDMQKYTIKEVNASVVLKNELDKWINQGFVIQASLSSGTNSLIRFTYVLVKED